MEKKFTISTKSKIVTNKLWVLQQRFETKETNCGCGKGVTCTLTYKEEEVPLVICPCWKCP
jgi:hypothetical protein